ncbi:MAG: type II toxin-antitoxin system MqsR family toxin [Candidatus Izemoplasmatales bacterium]|nr:type II toxin-antitoxin system MqsR family toxin [Candidatus Izemoplasmatales bacterium]
MNRINSDDKKTIEKFLKEIRNIIESPDFDIERDFIMEDRKEDTEIYSYSNYYTMLELNYNNANIINEIKSLTHENYHKTITDTVGNCVFLYIFFKVINEKNVYIKLGTYQRKREGPIICISFHFSDPNKELK